MNFKTWIDTLVEEKGIDKEEFLFVNGPSGENIIPIGSVIESMIMTSEKEQKAIKNMLVKIDFVNGDIKHYFKRLAHAIAL